MEKEVWKDIIGFEGLYQISNFGSVKSLNYRRSKKEKILNPTVNSSGYFVLALFKNGKPRSKYVHVLVARYFLNHTAFGRKIVVNHIDSNKTNNRYDNLEIISNRENTILGCIKNKKNTGAYKVKYGFISTIRIEDKRIYLGMFKTEEEAGEAYQKKLKEILSI